MTKQKIPISYTLPKTMNSEVFLRAHGEVIRRLASKGWEGGVERRQNGAFIWARHFKKPGFWKIRIALYDFGLATTQDIEPNRVYPTKHKILFRVSDRELMDVGRYIRWVADVNDPVFQKVKHFWEEYCRELNVLLR